MEIPEGITVIPEAEVVEVDGDAGILGRGALGEVRRGRWVPGAAGAVETPVALKRLFLLRNDVAALAEMGGALSEEERAAIVETFLTECATLSSANHPNILPFYGIVLDAARQPVFMATALVPSGSLSNLCRDERYAHFRIHHEDGTGVLSYAVVVDVLHDVFLALEYLHTRAQPVIHRDVKPANILVELNAAGQFQKAMLADLGEAKQVVRATRVAQSLGTVGVGTLLYMAPEMKEAELMKGPKVDVFSCGVAAAEIATGRCPSPGPEMVREGGRRVVVPEEERRQADIQAVVVPEFRAGVVERCITDDPADRADAAQMVAACRELQRTAAYMEARTALAAVFAQRVPEAVPPEPEPAPEPERVHPDAGEAEAAVADPIILARVREVAPDATEPPPSAVLLVYGRPGAWDANFNGYYQVDGEIYTKRACYRPCDPEKRAKGQGKSRIAQGQGQGLGQGWLFYGSTNFGYHFAGNAQSTEPPTSGWKRYGPGGGDPQPQLLWLDHRDHNG